MYGPYVDLGDIIKGVLNFDKSLCVFQVKFKKNIVRLILTKSRSD